MVGCPLGGCGLCGCQGLCVALAGCADMRVSDTIATARSVHISRMPASVPGKVISIDAAGWLLPKTGFAFTWTLDSELPRGNKHREAA